jgi:sialate O-acetylesterase
MLTDNWRFQIDPEQQGEKSGWGGKDFADQNWPLLQAGILWENQGYSYDGMAWYRRQLDVPAEWRGKKIVLVAEGVDDAYQLWINGKPIAFYGSFTDHSKTVFQIKTETDLTDYLVPGEKNTIVLQVVDVFGGGGITQPIYLRIE